MQYWSDKSFNSSGGLHCKINSMLGCWFLFTQFWDIFSPRLVEITQQDLVLSQRRQLMITANVGPTVSLSTTSYQ